jgi:hypothetical protein
MQTKTGGGRAGDGRGTDRQGKQPGAPPSSARLASAKSLIRFFRSIYYTAATGSAYPVGPPLVLTIGKLEQDQGVRHFSTCTS